MTAQGKPDRCPSDVCECGEYRSQHDNDGPCKICANSKAPYDGCTKFRFSRAATVAEQEHWNRWHSSPVPAAAPQPTITITAGSSPLTIASYNPNPISIAPELNVSAPQAESVPSGKDDGYWRCLKQATEHYARKTGKQYQFEGEASIQALMDDFAERENSLLRERLNAIEKILRENERDGYGYCKNCLEFAPNHGENCWLAILLLSFAPQNKENQ